MTRIFRGERSGWDADVPGRTRNAAAPKFGRDRRAPQVLLLAGERLREPVAMGGPIVMNYDSEIQDAYRELRDGTFLKSRG